MPDLQGNHLFLQGTGPHDDHALAKIAVVATTLIYSFEGPFSICAYIAAKSALPDNKVQGYPDCRLRLHELESARSLSVVGCRLQWCQHDCWSHADSMQACGIICGSLMLQYDILTSHELHQVSSSDTCAA